MQEHWQKKVWQEQWEKDQEAKKRWLEDESPGDKIIREEKSSLFLDSLFLCAERISDDEVMDNIPEKDWDEGLHRLTDGERE